MERNSPPITDSLDLLGSCRRRYHESLSQSLFVGLTFYLFCILTHLEPPLPQLSLLFHLFILYIFNPIPFSFVSLISFFFSFSLVNYKVTTAALIPYRLVQMIKGSQQAAKAIHAKHGTTNFWSPAHSYRQIKAAILHHQQRDSNNSMQISRLQTLAMSPSEALNIG